MEGDKSLATTSKLTIGQQTDNLVDQILQSDLMLDRFIQKLTTAHDSAIECGQSSVPLATRFFGRILSSKRLMPKLCAAIENKDASGSDDATVKKMPTPKGKNELADRFLGKLFQYYPVAEFFWIKLVDDDLFAEGVLEPVFANQDILESVTDRLLEHEQLLELM